MFFKGSRYEKVPEAEHTDASGRTVRYKKVRFIPFTRAQAGHEVRDGERLDHIAHRHFRDAERFWRICDANLATWPPELVERPGRIIDIPASEGNR
jgi:hypothetical protein